MRVGTVHPISRRLVEIGLNLKTSDPEPPATAQRPVLYCWAVSMLSSAMLVSLPVLAEPQHFSLAEKLIFATLAIASGYLFWHRFGVVLDKILKSKKDS